jgi:DNA-binding beta-propeller fold protein YncE
VNGRIDHMDVNLKDGIVYVAALGNNSLEVADIKNGTLVHSIKGLDEPQGVGYIPQHNEIFVANGGNGACEFYNAKSFAKLATIKLSSDADDVRYDSANRKIYVGYGNGGIAVIDADSHKQIGDIKLPAHPEGFQLDKSIDRLYVNVPDAGIIAVIDINKQELVGQWKTDGAANFPMAIDTMNHRVFIGYRSPAKFVVLDGRTGQKLSAHETVGDMDDLYYDSNAQTVMASGGGGAIQIFKQEQGSFKQLANIPTRNGARTSLLIPQLKTFILAERAGNGKNADLLVYTIQD